MDLAAIISDAQIPFQDDIVLRRVGKFIKTLQPTHFYILGDWVDFYALSTHDRDPARRFRLKQELQEQERLLEDITPDNAILTFIEGNHEDRLRRYLWQKAPELDRLDSLSLPELLKLDQFGYRHVPYRQGVFHNKHKTFFLTHGDMVRGHSAYTARGMMDKFSVSGISGHTHRLGAYYRTNLTGPKVWLENGCLCRLDPDWTSYPNWQHGFTLVTFDGKQFWAEQVPIIDGKFIYGGKAYYD